MSHPVIIMTDYHGSKFSDGRPGQTMQIQIRLLLYVQSGLDFHWLLFHLRLLEDLLHSKSFRINSKVIGYQILKVFYRTFFSSSGLSFSEASCILGT